MTVFNHTTSMQRFRILSLITTLKMWRCLAEHLDGIQSLEISPNLNSWTVLSSRLVAAGMSSLGSSQIRLEPFVAGGTKGCIAFPR